MRRGIVLVLLLPLLAPSAAASPATRAHYERVALRYWDRPVDVLWHHADLPGRLIMRAEVGGRNVWLDTGRWSRLPYERRCTVFLHEYGHLLGRRHSRDPRDLMFPVLLADAPTPGACRGFVP